MHLMLEKFEIASFLDAIVLNKEEPLWIHKTEMNSE